MNQQDEDAWNGKILEAFVCRPVSFFSLQTTAHSYVKAMRLA
jgi:hypothetical protein